MLIYNSNYELLKECEEKRIKIDWWSDFILKSLLILINLLQFILDYFMTTTELFINLSDFTDFIN